jgi:hypothetical protein
VRARYRQIKREITRHWAIDVVGITDDRAEGGMVS